MKEMRPGPERIFEDGGNLWGLERISFVKASLRDERGCTGLCLRFVIRLICVPLPTSSGATEMVAVCLVDMSYSRVVLF